MAIGDLTPCQIGALQEFLKEKGLFTDAIDGRLEGGTVGALEEFQRTNGMGT